MNLDWAEQFNAAITVCDETGIILSMNQRAAATFSKDGGLDLIGKNLLDCHPQPARAKLAELLKHPRVNVYTIEKNGQKKMIYQAPWFKSEKFAGLVEVSLPIPAEIPHFLRQ